MDEKKKISELRWAHGVNTIEDLKQVMKSKKYDAIEADITYNRFHKKSIMKHSIETESQIIDDLALEWLKIALSIHKQEIGILKLDFKSLRAVESVVHFVKENELETSPHIMLNADILVGPGMSKNDTPPIDAHEFLRLCSILPNATLSLGWTTNWSPLSTILYEKSYINEMIQILDELVPKERHVTFPIRASLMRDSWKVLLALLNYSPNTTITLWTGLEGVPEEDLKWVSNMQKDRVYVDCDKGPKHTRGHPARLVSYIYYGLRHKYGI